MSDDRQVDHAQADVIALPAPRPYREVIAMWPDALYMDEEFFAAEAVRASTANTYMNILIMTIVGAVVSVLSAYIYGLPGGGTPSLSNPGPTDAVMTVSMLYWIVGRVAGILVFNYLIYMFAQLFGGRASFGQQLYAQTLFQAPIGIFMTLASLAPGIGLILALMLAVYTMVLNARVLRGVHGIGKTGAVVSSVLPAVLTLVLLAVAFVGLSTVHIG